MYKLDLGFSNPELYRGCKVTEYEPGKFRLDTPIDSAVVIMAANLLRIVQSVPQIDRDVLVLTGATRPEILLTVQSVLRPFFGQCKFLNGRTGDSIDIPSSSPEPPESHDGEPE